MSTTPWPVQGQSLSSGNSRSKVKAKEYRFHDYQGQSLEISLYSLKATITSSSARDMPSEQRIIVYYEKKNVKVLYIKYI
jgi:hypothetical protein